MITLLFLLLVSIPIISHANPYNNCVQSSDCISSLNEWASRSKNCGLKYIEQRSGRVYYYCMHKLSAEFEDIESNATLKSIVFWYNFDHSYSGHAAIEIIFSYNDHYVVAFLEGFERLVSVHLLYGKDAEIGTEYLKNRSTKAAKYERLVIHNVIRGNEIKYFDLFEGPIHKINRMYVRRVYKKSEIVNGAITLNHGCLWYAMHLFAELSQMDVHELMTHPNVSDPILKFRQIL